DSRRGRNPRRDPHRPVGQPRDSVEGLLGRAAQGVQAVEAFEPSRLVDRDSAHGRSIVLARRSSPTLSGWLARSPASTPKPWFSANPALLTHSSHRTAPGCFTRSSGPTRPPPTNHARGWTPAIGTAAARRL